MFQADIKRCVRNSGERLLIFVLNRKSKYIPAFCAPEATC